MAAPVHRLRTEHKLDEDSLKTAFDASSIEKREKVKNLVHSISERIRTGIETNRRDYRLFKAMDWAFDQPFYQISVTQLKHLISSQPDDKKVMETLNNWGLTHMLSDVLDGSGQPCCDSTGKRKKSLNLPVFFNIFVPIVMAYITIRWAKLFNDRNVTPHFKYEPVQYTKENRLRCEIITQVVQRQSSWFDYPADTKQSILQTLLYGFCINFPREAWFVEKQEDESGNEKIVREGLRFGIYHPSRNYWDQFHRLSTLNSNSGCAYVGNWGIQRYEDIFNNKQFWNKDKISYGAQASWFEIGTSDFLSQVYPCSLSFPMSARDGSGGTGALDREASAAGMYTVTSNKDAATLVTNHFERLVPADHGLGTYKYPIWMRFMLASDNAVLWAEPLAFDRFPTYTYDADFNRSRFRSMALEIVPFQDHIGNLLTQWILAVKQNLMNPVFYDKDKVSADYIKQLENAGHKLRDGTLWIPFSSTENYRINTQQQGAFHQPQLTKHDTAQIATLIDGVLGMLDRVLLFSPQEVGQAASHEQTAEETKVIAGNTSTRVEFTGSGIDAGDYAKKVMIYDATMAYADDDITVGITTDMADTDEELKKLIAKLGFTIEDKERDTSTTPSGVTVKGKKSAIRLETFSSTRDKSDRIDNAAIADAMAKMFIAIASNEGIIMSVGPVQLVELLNQIMSVAGLPKEFRLRGKNVDMTQPAEQQAQQVSQMLTGLSEQIRQAIDQSAQQTLAAAADQTAQIVAQATAAIAQQVQPLAQAVAQASQVNALQQEEIQALGQAVSKITQAVEMMQPPAPIAQPVNAAPPVGVPA